jgi:hypothetical protein
MHPPSPQPSRRRLPAYRPDRPRFQPRFDILEGRNLLSFTIPVLNSDPGSGHTLYLDFAGFSQPRWSDGVHAGIPETTVLPFSVDDQQHPFTLQDVSAMREIWQRVAEDFAPFDINVTTVEPPTLAPGMPDSAADGNALRVVIGDLDPSHSDPVLTGGPGPTGMMQRPQSDPWIGAFTNDIPNVRFVFPDHLPNAFAVANAASQGAGHAFGLHNQSRPPDLRLAIMGDRTSDPEVRSTWYNGTNELGMPQDDVALLTQVLGQRPEHDGATPDSATPLLAPPAFDQASGTAGNRLAGAGIIGALDDVDYYSFRVAGEGPVTLRLNFGVGVDVNQPQPQDGPGANLAARVQVWTADGARLVAEYSAVPDVSSGAGMGREWVVPAVAPLTLARGTALSAGGRYLIAVRSSGTYGDLGNYTLSVDGPVGYGPRVTTAIPSALSGTDGPILPGPGVRYETSSVRVTFDQPIDRSTFTPDDVVFTGPSGPIAITRVIAVNLLDPRAFDVVFPLQTQVGEYTMTIGPHITGLGGFARPGGRPGGIFGLPGLEMDQDEDGDGGRAPEDAFTFSFSLGDGPLQLIRFEQLQEGKAAGIHGPLVTPIDPIDPVGPVGPGIVRGGALPQGVLPLSDLVGGSGAASPLLATPVQSLGKPASVVKSARQPATAAPSTPRGASDTGTRSLALHARRLPGPLDQAWSDGLFDPPAEGPLSRSRP